MIFLVCQNSAAKYASHITKPNASWIDLSYLPDVNSGSKIRGFQAAIQTPADTVTRASVCFEMAFLLLNCNTWEYHKSKLVVLSSINLIVDINWFAITEMRIKNWWEVTGCQMLNIRQCQGHISPGQTVKGDPELWLPKIWVDAVQPKFTSYKCHNDALCYIWSWTTYCV